MPAKDEIIVKDARDNVTENENNNLLNKEQLEKSINWIYETVDRVKNELRNLIAEERESFAINLLNRLLVEVEKALNKSNNYFNYFNYNYNYDQSNKVRTMDGLGQAMNRNATLLTKTRDLVYDRSYQVVQKAMDLIRYAFTLLCENKLIDSLTAKFKIKFLKDIVCTSVITLG